MFVGQREGGRSRSGKEQDRDTPTPPFQAQGSADCGSKSLQGLQGKCVLREPVFSKSEMVVHLWGGAVTWGIYSGGALTSTG